ncbi:unnamed protein product [Protopolystoma xenopodis]|uniref:Uncharacterized protein n=1 Tax=Protopolystoma xenopodis TaxID=117903 RepID=A0A448XCI3_9PLAT|nr:unnamed protein product [Protopolystoma xenopodis]
MVFKCLRVGKVIGRRSPERPFSEGSESRVLTTGSTRSWLLWPNGRAKTSTYLRKQDCAMTLLPWWAFARQTRRLVPITLDSDEA